MAILSDMEEGGYSMANGYHHLTYGSRCQIYALKKSGASVRGHCAFA